MPTRLGRRLDVGDAVVVGLGSMVGAGAFAVLAPAARAAGSGLLIGLVAAAFVAACNATSSAALAASYPASGGAYVYGRERLGPFWGHLAGWGFVVGKTASCAAMALTVGVSLSPAWSRPIAVGAVVTLTAVNARGVRKTVVVTRALVAFVLTVLASVVVGAAFGGTTRSEHLALARSDLDVAGILQSAGLLFFAFAGYARIATLGEEVVDPARTIPKAVARALGITLAVYVIVAISALAAVGSDALATSPAPLATAVDAGDLDALVPLVRLCAAVASGGVLVSLLAGVSRTVFAMAADGALPTWLSAVHPRHHVPHRAGTAVGGLAALVVAVADVRSAIGFSSFCVLAYYAIANASAWTLPGPNRIRRRALAGAGLVGCLVLAGTLPLGSVLTGSGVLGAGVVVWLASPASGRDVAHRHAGGEAAGGPAGDESGTRVTMSRPRPDRRRRVAADRRGASRPRPSPSLPETPSD